MPLRLEGVNCDSARTTISCPVTSIMLIRVVAAVVEHRGKYLICLRPQHKRHGGLWEFPGGKIEADESIPEAITRELAEELSVAVTRTGEVLYSRVDHGSAFEILFVPTDISGEPTAMEHDQLAWCHPEAMLDLPLAPSDRQFVIEHLISDER